MPPLPFRFSACICIVQKHAEHRSNEDKYCRKECDLRNNKIIEHQIKGWTVFYCHTMYIVISRPI